MFLKKKFQASLCLITLDPVVGDTGFRKTKSKSQTGN